MLSFHPNIQVLFAASLLRGLGTTNPASFGPFTLGMTVYSGAAPTTASVTATWSVYNSSTSNYLVHYTDGQWYQPTTSTSMLQLTPPTPQTPVRAGTASWAIIWGDMGTGRAPNSTELSSTTLPRAIFMIVSVSDAVGDGVLRFASTSLTTAGPVSITDGSIGVNF